MSITTVGMLHAKSNNSADAQDKQIVKTLDRLDAEKIEALCKQLEKMSNAKREDFLMTLDSDNLLKDKSRLDWRASALHWYGVNDDFHSLFSNNESAFFCVLKTG